MKILVFLRSSVRTLFVATVILAAVKSNAATCTCKDTGTVGQPSGYCICDASGTYEWTRPSKVTTLEMIGCGGGGGGGQAGGAGQGNPDNAGGGGGGEGAPVYWLQLDGLSDAKYTITVGAQGDGGTGPSAVDGKDGQPSSFASNGGAPFRVKNLDSSGPPIVPLANLIMFRAGVGGKGGAYAFQGGAGGKGGSAPQGASEGDGHGPASTPQDVSQPGANSRFANGGRGMSNCQYNVVSGGSGGGGGGSYGPGGDGGCGASSGNARAGGRGDKGAGGGGGGGYGENQIPGMPGGHGGGGYILITWGGASPQ